MSDTELVTHLGDCMDSIIIRSLLVAEVLAVRAGARRDPHTMRHHLWYRLCKPALSRLGILNKATANGRPIDWAAKVSVYMAELVREGFTTYKELSIVDGSRLRQPALEVEKTLLDVPLVGAHFPWVILFTEKDAIYDVVRRVASLYGVSVISGSGQPSFACTENTVRVIVGKPAYKEEKPTNLVLVSLTDYDPAGYTIAAAQHQQLLEAVEVLSDKERGRLSGVVHNRIGLEPGQLTPEEVEANAYEPKDKGLDEWLEATGGLDGEPLGLELDALPISRVRRFFAEGLEQYIDLDKRGDDLREAFVDLLVWEALEDEFEAKRERLSKAVKGAPVWQAIVDTPLPPNLFQVVAEAGWSLIDPVEATEYLTGTDLFDAHLDAVRAALSSASAGDGGGE